MLQQWVRDVSSALTTAKDENENENQTEPSVHISRGNKQRNNEKAQLIKIHLIGSTVIQTTW